MLQFTTFREKIVPAVEKIAADRERHTLSTLNSRFFKDKLKTEKNRLAHRIRKHLIESEYRKTILENKGELKYLYFVGLMRSSADNRIGKFIRKNSDQWAQTLNLEENLLKMYITCCSEPVPVSNYLKVKPAPSSP